MKKIAAAVLLAIVAVLPRPSNAISLSLDLGKGFSVGISTSLTSAYADAQRDYYNGMWLIGYGYEIFPLSHRDSQSGIAREVAYVGAYNDFAVGDGKGVFGLDLGIHLPTLILNGIGWIKTQDIIASLPPWAQKLQAVTALEVGAGDRIFGISRDMAAQGIKRQCYTVGAHLNYPVEWTMANLFNHPGSL